MTRKHFLMTGAGALLAGMADPLYWEPRNLETSRTHVRIAAKLHSPIRIAHLSDLHASTVVPLGMIDHAVTVALAQKPELILLTGDFISHRDEPELSAYSHILRRLSVSAPTFAILGNHDGGAWSKLHGGYEDHRWVERLLEDSQIELLHNRSQTVEIAGQKISLVGVGDLWADELDSPRAFRGVESQNPVVLLSHNPDSKDRLAAFPWDLMLCGHTHGGQVVLPHWGPRWAPVKDKRFVAGLHPWASKQIYVTRGVGNLFGIRFRCPPEVSILTLQA